MLWILIGILLGVIIGFAFNIPIPQESVSYIAVIMVVAADVLLRVINSEFAKKKYETRLFIAELVFNTVFAFLITYLGEQLGVGLYLAVAIVFILRIFQTIDKIKEELLKKYS